MYHGYAIFQGFLGVLKVDLLTFQVNMPFVLVVDAKQAFHQSGLSCAVLAHEGMDGSGSDRQGYVIQCLNAGEGLADVLHPEKDLRLLRLNAGGGGCVVVQ